MATEVKNWKQQLRVLFRKLDSNAKDTPKMFPFNITVSPYNEKISLMLMEAEQMQSKTSKQEKITFSKLTNINKSLDQLKDVLKHYQQTNEFLVKVQNLSENAYEKMQSFKIKMADSYDELADLEDKISQQLQLYSRKIQSIEQGNNQFTKNNQQNKAKNNQQQKMIEQRKVYARKQQSKQEANIIQQLQQKMKLSEMQCQKVDNQINAMGKNLGWVQEDHQDFITIWNRGHGQKNYFEIQDELINYFTLYTQEQIKDHMKKYMHLKNLIKIKKDLIYQYKLLKQQKKNEELKAVQLLQINTKDQRNQELRKKREEQQKIIKEKVKAWKQQKLQQQKLNRQNQQHQKQLNKLHNMTKKSEQQEKRKEMLEKWKQQQQQKKKQSVQASRKRPVSAINRQTEQRIRERQQKIIKEKMQRVINKKLQQQQMMKKMIETKEKKMVKYAHIQNKLDYETTTIKEKKRQKFDGVNKKQADTFGGKLLGIGVRAVPSWRQGL